jgi:hypothetical protein
MPRCALLFALVLCGHAAAQCETATFLAGDGAASDTFGNSVSLWDDRALVTSIYDDGIGNDSGSAYIFERQGSTWVQAIKLIASDEAEDDRYGHSGAIHGDQAIVGARYNQDAGYGSGSAYIYERQGGVWVETAYLVAATPQPNAFFGQASDIENDVAVVSASIQNGAAGATQGAVHVFGKQGGNWTETQVLTASDASAGARFGSALSMDGNTLVVGARDESEKGAQAGAAYVFESVGGVWTETAKLTAGDPEAGALFGAHVAIHGDVITATALLEDSMGADTGAVYVFERDGADWVQVAKLLPDTTASTLFGTAAIWGDTILVGASFDSQLGQQSGAVHCFKRIDGVWTRTGRFTADTTGDLDAFGTAVALWGTDALISARNAKNSSGVKAGKAYVFDHVNDIVPYGAGSPGTGGLVPTLTLAGCPGPGGVLDVDIADGAPGSLAIVFFGLNQDAWPLVGCTLLTYPLLPLELNLTLDGNGAVSFSGQIPPGFGGTATIQLQVFVSDPGGPEGFSSTAAVDLTIGG